MLHVARDGEIDDVVKLPDASNAQQVRFGFEGVASVGPAANEVLFVAFQREWQNDPEGYVRIGRYETATRTWSFYYYPLDEPESPNGGWVGLSEISALNAHEFAVIERDNQASSDARIKKFYRFSVRNMTPLQEPLAGTPAFPKLSKTLARDLLPVLTKTGGMVLEKIEGMAVNSKGDAWIVNDNDAVDDSNGETQLIKLKALAE